MAETQAIAAPRQYETIYVLRPDAGREASENISTRVLDVISKQHGSLTRVENWGYRKLAYPVRKHGRGVYVYLTWPAGQSWARLASQQLPVEAL